MKIKLLSLLCALLLLVGALPAASALDGEALRSANTLAALNLVDSAGAAVDYNQNAPASRADAVLLLVRLAGAEKAAKAAAAEVTAEAPAKPARKRRTKAEIEADKAAKEAAKADKPARK